MSQRRIQIVHGLRHIYYQGDKVYILEFCCEFCNKSIIEESKKKKTKRFCSQACINKHRFKDFIPKPKTKKFYREFQCKECKTDVKEAFDYQWKANRKKEFCSHHCVMIDRHRTGSISSKGERNPMYNRSFYDVWKEKYGEEAAQELETKRLKNCSIASSGKKNGMYGRTHTKIAREKISKSATGRIVSQETREKLSKANSGKNNPMYGKTSMGGRSVKGYYRDDIFFRSLLELSYMIHLENLGYDLYNDVTYESILIPYRCGERTYRPDFYLIKEKTIIEVKPFLLTTTKLNLEKFLAAQKYCKTNGLIFKIVTEKDIEKITFKEAIKSKKVKLIESSLKGFKPTNRD